ncbi:MAG: DUF2288 domain-containing protein [Methylococcales bacterium]|nr:DUF2288 domain-containing protein [Methylococcales bacterium]
MENSDLSPDKIKVNLETSKIPWHELQRFFAAGVAIAVSGDLDLVEVACQFAVDNKAQVELWLENGQVGHVSDQQAGDWLANGHSVWAVVVKPWILVQTAD